ncbi:hypothetical protein DXA14_29905 [Hungatella hathewayi]|nr:hypothetical protein DXA14_29905 [Hungatella hathewayi]
MEGYADVSGAVEEKGARAAGRAGLRDLAGVGLRADSRLRRGPGLFDRTLDEFALRVRKTASCKRGFAPAPTTVRPKSHRPPYHSPCPPCRPHSLFRPGYETSAA